MKIQCDVCERAEATVICCADEAALCARCDVEVHEANKLASKHQRLLLHSLNNKLPKCDICQEKAAFIFCVEDRALFCRDCDEPIHSGSNLSGNHQRLLVTGIQVALSSICAKKTEMVCSDPPPSQNSVPVSESVPAPPQPSSYGSPTWAVDDLLQFSDFEPNYKKGESMGFGELEWFSDIGMFGDQVPPPQEALAAAEVPQLHASHHQPPPSYSTLYNRPLKSSSSSYLPLSKKPRIEISEEDDFFTVPDLG